MSCSTNGLKSNLLTIIKHIKTITRIDSIGIRLKDGFGDFPYYVYDGFSDDFIKLENSLCSRNEQGGIIYINNVPVLDCVCGAVVKGEIDNTQSYFTKRGSFWTNSTTELLSRGIVCHGKLRGTCNTHGYETVVLVPIRVSNNIIGLIQLNNKEPKNYTKNYIEYLEILVDLIGLSIYNYFLCDQLDRINSELQDLKKMI